MRLTFSVHGLPQTKGSARALPSVHTMRIFKSGRPLVLHGYKQLAAATIVTDVNKDLRAWSTSVNKAAWCAMQDLPAAERKPVAGPIAIRLDFRLARPKKLRGQPWHITRPDLDKLARAVKDALTDVVWQDDGQVVELVTTKGYARLEEQPGVVVDVMTIDPDLFADDGSTRPAASEDLFAAVRGSR